MSNERQLTPAEWRLMECLWEKSPRTGRETVEYMEKYTGWSRSTTLTVLHRMSEKGCISCVKEGTHARVYAPLIPRDKAVVRETENFMERVYKGSVSLLMTGLTDRRQLSKEEIDELYAILDKAKENAR